MDLRSLLTRGPRDQRPPELLEQPGRCDHDDDPATCLGCLLDELWPPVSDPMAGTVKASR